jgi:hypothetical protein
MAIDGQVITPERDLLLQLVKFYKTCRIESKAAKGAIADVSQENRGIGALLEAKRQQRVAREEQRTSAEFRALEAALLGEKPYLPALRLLLQRHQPRGQAVPS